MFTKAIEGSISRGQYFFFFFFVPVVNACNGRFVTANLAFSRILLDQSRIFLQKTAVFL